VSDASGNQLRKMPLAFGKWFVRICEDACRHLPPAKHDKRTRVRTYCKCVSSLLTELSACLENPFRKGYCNFQRRSFVTAVVDS